MTLEWRRLGDQETDHERLWLGVGALGLVAALMLAGAPEGVPACAWKTLTGLPCPGCGTMRAVLALVPGLDLMSALRWNPLAALAVTSWVVWGCYAAVVLVARLPRFRLTWSEQDVTCVRWIASATLAATWAFLVIDGR